MPWDYRQPEPEKPDKKRKWLLRGAMGLSLALALYGAVRLTGYGLDWFSARETSRELKEIAQQAEASPEGGGTLSPEAEGPPSPAPTPSPGPRTPEVSPEPVTADPGVLPRVTYPAGMTMNPKIQTLRKRSEYIIGWLTMDDLDEPVVMKDNTFFLNHDVLGKRNDNGALFLDEGTELLSRPYTLMIYGHNMKTGAMFGKLRKYEEPSYCYQHRYLEFDTLFETGRYEIFAASVINLNPGLSRYLSLAALDSPIREIRQQAITTLQHLSSVPGLTRVEPGDQLLLLITCVGSDDERLVVAARRLEDGERKAGGKKEGE